MRVTRIVVLSAGIVALTAGMGRAQDEKRIHVNLGMKGELKVA